MKSMPGTYALILQSEKRSRIQVGRWREIGVDPGYYIYVGSAFGPGGVRARVTRHCRKTKTSHWHIDYLREVMKVLGAWISYEPDRLEHRWAQTLCSVEGVAKVPGAGCTDCDCQSHLFFSSCAPSFAFYSNLMEGKIVNWKYENSA
jgi:Uri superfamily endonuclease